MARDLFEEAGIAPAADAGGRDLFTEAGISVSRKRKWWEVDEPEAAAPEPEKPASRSWGQWAKDMALSGIQGLDTMATIPAMVYDRATTGDWFGPEAQRVAGMSDEREELKSDFARERDQAKSLKAAEAGQRAIERFGTGAAGTAARVAAEFGTGLVESVKDPASLPEFVANQIAQLGVMGKVGRGAQIAAGGLARAAPGLAATRAGQAALGSAGTGGAIGFGATLQGVDVGSETMQRLMELPDEQWSQVPGFAALADEIGADAAKQRMASTMATSAGVKGAGVSALTAALIPGGSSIERALTTGRGVGLKALPKVYLGEGGQEGVEEGYGKFATNKALQAVNPEQDPFEDVGGTAGQAMHLGGALGVGVNVTRSGAIRRPKQGIEQPPMTAEQEARLDELTIRSQSDDQPLDDAEKAELVELVKQSHAERQEGAQPGEAQYPGDGPQPDGSYRVTVTMDEPGSTMQADQQVNPDARLAELDMISGERELTPQEQEEAAQLAARLDESEETEDEPQAPVAAQAPVVEPEAEATPEPVSAEPEARQTPAEPVQPEEAPAETPAEAPAGQPADELATGSLPPDQDQSLQNRDRSRAASVAQMHAIAQDPDYLRLGPSRTPDSGAPMVFAVGDNTSGIPPENFGQPDVAVMSDGQRVPFRYAVVDASTVNPSNFADGARNPGFDSQAEGTLKALNNGRTAGVRASHEIGTADDYVQGLIDDVRVHGVPAESISATPNPMLVRVYSERQNTQDMAAKSQGQGLGMSPVELARQDAGLLDGGTLSSYQPGDVTSAANRDFVRAFVGRMQSAGQDVAGLMQANGELSQDGRRRIEAALMQSAYDDADLIGEMFDSTETDVKTIGEVLKRSAGEWARMRDLARGGAINPETDVTDNLMDAVRMVRKARRDRLALLDMVNQPDILTGQVPDPLTVGMLRLFYSGDRLTRAVGSDKLQASLADYMRGAQATSAGADMFGGAPVSALQILETITGGPNAQVQPQDRGEQPAGGDAARGRAGESRDVGQRPLADQGRQEPADAGRAQLQQQEAGARDQEGDRGDGAAGAEVGGVRFERRGKKALYLHGDVADIQERLTAAGFRRRGARDGDSLRFSVEDEPRLREILASPPESAQPAGATDLRFSRDTTAPMPDNQAPGPQGDAQQGANEGSAVAGQFDQRFMDNDMSGLAERAKRVAYAEEDYRLPNLANAVPGGMVPRQAAQRMVTLYRGVPATVSDAQVRPGDWVALSRSYANQHGTGQTGSSKVVSVRVPASDVVWAGTDMNEFFYAPKIANDGESALDMLNRVGEAGFNNWKAANEIDASVRSDAKESQAERRSAGERGAQPGTPVSAIRTAIRRAYGKLLERLEANGMVELHQTEVEAIEAAAQARAEATGESVEDVRKSLMASVQNSLSPMKSVDANVRRGRAALAKALDERTSVHSAMFRNGLGWVDFVWGDSNRGLQHIMKRRADSDGMSEADVVRFMHERLVDVIAGGDEVRRSELQGGVRLVIGDDVAQAVLVRKSGSNAWMLTGFELRPDAAGRGATGSTATDAAATRSRDSAVAGQGSIAGGDVDVNLSANGAIEGFHDPVSGKSFLIADALTAETAGPTLIHEVGVHMAKDGVLDQMIAGAVNLRDTQPNDATIKRALARMEEAGETSDEELAAYLVTEYERDRAKSSQPVRQWFRDAWAAVRSWLHAKGIMSMDGRMKPADVAAMARASARRAAQSTPATEAGNVSRSVLDTAQSALRELASLGDVFAFPKSDKTTVAEIAAENDPGIKVAEPRRFVNRTEYKLTMPNGKTATLTVREPNPYGESAYDMRTTDDGLEMVAGRPGVNPEDVLPTGDVWIDVSNLATGDQGAMVYNIAATFAHNTDRIFIGDPHGLSKTALRRRLEQMLSSALKFGTTRHLAPHPDQTRGGHGVPPIDWVYGDDVGNIARMVAASVQALDNVFSSSRLVEYDPEQRSFRRADTGQQLSREQLARMVGQSIETRREVAGSPPGKGEAGWRTVARAAVFRALLREAGSGVQGDRGLGSSVLGKPGDGNLQLGVPLIRALAANAQALSNADPNRRIFYSRAGQALQSAKQRADSLTSSENIDALIYNVQDKHIDLKRLRDHIKSLGGTINDLNDAYQGEELYHERVAKRTKDFLQDELRPLLADMRARNVQMADFETFLHARHAPEANAELAKRNPDAATIDAERRRARAEVGRLETQLQKAQQAGSATKAIKDALRIAREDLSHWQSAQAFKGTQAERMSLSGMSDADAAAFMAGLSRGQRVHMDALAKRVDDINEKTLNYLQRYGLMSKEALDNWRNTYQHYVPLHRDEAHAEGTSHPIGQGFSTRGDAGKARVGSNEKVTNILGHIVMQREAALTRGEKNRVVKQLYLMLAQNPDPNIGTVGRVPTIRVVGSDGLVRTVPEPGYQNKPNVIMVRIAGRDAAIVMNENNPQALRMAGALKNLDASDMGWAMQQVAKATRWFASVNTQYNPIFGFVNLARDTQAMSLQLSNTELAGSQREVLARVIPNVLAIYRDARNARDGKPTGQSRASRDWNEMQDEGGTTGYRDLYRKPEERAKALSKELMDIDRGNTKKAALAIVNWLSDFNEAMENGTRLAVYQTAVAHGLSKPRAASLSKNITVNFNRRGAKGRELGIFYAFFNASMQGSARLIEAVKGPAGKRIIAGGIALGIIQELLGMAIMGGGDDDQWEKIPDFIKENSLVIPISRTDYISIPMALGYHVLPNIGRKAVEFATHDQPTGRGKHVVDLILTALDGFNPMGGGNDFAQVVSPTITDPAVALWRNRDWTGTRIFREDMSGLDPTPGHARRKDSASAISIGIAKALNRITGGNEYKPGMISWTPDQLDFVFGQLTGGVGRESLKAMQTVQAPFTGDELPAYKIPGLSRIYGNTRGAAGESGKYYENMTKINMAHNEAKGRLRNDDGGQEFIENEPLVGLTGQARAAENSIRLLRKRRSALIREGKPGWRQEVRALNEQIGERMKALNKSVQAVESAR